MLGVFVVELRECGALAELAALVRFNTRHGPFRGSAMGLDQSEVRLCTCHHDLMGKSAKTALNGLERYLNGEKTGAKTVKNGVKTGKKRVSTGVYVKF